MQAATIIPDSAFGAGIAPRKVACRLQQRARITCIIHRGTFGSTMTIAVISGSLPPAFEALVICARSRPTRVVRRMLFLS